jgi:hypothetical protein
MPLFYLHVLSTDGMGEDLEGADFPDLDAAKDEAREGIRALVADALFSGTELRVRSVEIRDETGKMLESVTLAQAIMGVIPIDVAFEADLSRYLKTPPPTPTAPQ